jgi:hypothetical protein
MAVQPGPLMVLVYDRFGPSGEDTVRLKSMEGFTPEVWGKVYLALYKAQGKTFYQTEDLGTWEFTNDTLRRTMVTDPNELHPVTDQDVLQLLITREGFLTDIQLPVSILQPAYVFELHLVTY